MASAGAWPRFATGPPHGWGDIDLQSALGQGSTFPTSLPSGEAIAAGKGPLSAPDEPHEVASRRSGLTVLVAMDDPFNEPVMNQLLQRLGRGVRHTRDDDRAVQLWAQGGVDMVLMDVCRRPAATSCRSRTTSASRPSPAVRRTTPVVAVTASGQASAKPAWPLARTVAPHRLRARRP